MGEIPHVLYVYANDSANNWASQEFWFTTDDIEPLLILESPVNNTSQPSGTLIDIAIRDAHLHTVLYNWDDAANQSWTGDYKTVVPMGDMQHILYVYANDSVGNWVFQRFMFTTDDTNPTIDVSSPINTIYNQNYVTITYTVSKGTVTIYVDEITNITALSSGSVISDLDDGIHHITIIARDAAGNIGVTTVIFTIDTTLPTTTTPVISTTATTTEGTSTTSEAAPGSFPGVVSVVLCLVAFAVVFRRRK